jgi:hypothetical protein
LPGEGQQGCVDELQMIPSAAMLPGAPTRMTGIGTSTLRPSNAADDRLDLELIATPPFP